MTTTRKAHSASVAAGLLLASFMAAPVAHADVLADLRGTVTADRLKYGPSCPPLRYNNVLQDIGFAQGQFVPDTAKSQGMIASYPGEVRSFIGVGDPMAAARTNAYEKGAGSLIGNCAWTEYGVSFIRYEPTETDWVGIVFGKPSGVTTPPSGPGAGGGQDPAPAGTPAPPQMKACPPGGLKPEVPAGEQCPAPANAVRVSFVRAPFQWTVNVKNNAGIGGSCNYDARSTSGATGASREFDIDSNGSTTFQVPAPLPFTTYHVVTSCTGSYEGRQVEFGHDEQDVSL